VVTECVENILKAPSAAWKNRIKEVVQAARQDERQKMLKRFMREKKSWDTSRSSDRNTITSLQEDLKKKDISISWLKSCLSERDNQIIRLKQNVAALERHLEAEITTRVQNAESMKQILGGHKALYPGLLNFGATTGADPFHEVANDLLRQHKISEQMEMNEDDQTTSSHVSENPFGDEKGQERMQSFMN